MQNIHLTKKEKKVVESNEVIPEQTLRIVLGVIVVVGAIYLTGKFLRLMGETVRDVRYFVNSVQNK